MKILLYNCKCDPVVVNKSSFITKYYDLEGTLRKSTAVLSPSIDIEIPNNENIVQLNYAYIPNFGRYYFVKNIISIRNNIWRFNLTVDVLMSHMDNIKRLDVFVNRNEFDYNINISDDKLPFESVAKRELSTPLSDSMFAPLKNAIKYFITLTSIQDPTAGSTNVIDFGLGCIPSDFASPVSRSTRTFMVEDSTEFTKFIERVSTDSALSSQVVSIIVVPLNKVLSDNEYTNFSSIVMYGQNGDPINIECKCKYIKANVQIYTANTFRYDIADIDFTYYNPYSIYELYIPFYGWYELDASQFLNKNIVIFTTFDITNGTAQTSLYVGDVDANLNPTNITDYIGNVSYQVGASLPISFSGSADAKRTYESNYQKAIGESLTRWIRFAGNTVLSTGSDVMSAIGAVSNPKPIVSDQSMSLFGSLEGAWNNLADEYLNWNNFEANMLTNVARGGTSNFSSCYLSFFSGFKYYIRRTYYTPSVNLTEYASMHGRPLKEYRQIKSLRGYTVVGEVFFNLPNYVMNWTLDEENLIRRHLYSGVIL